MTGPWTWHVPGWGAGHAETAADAAAQVWSTWAKWGPRRGACVTGPGDRDAWHCGPPGTFEAAVEALRRLAPDWQPPAADVESARLADAARR